MLKEIVTIKNRLIVPFEWLDPTPGGSNLGRAEFMVCIKFKRGKLSEYWVDPRQQRIDKVWHYIGTFPEHNQFMIQSYQRLDEPNIWMVSYCEQHKTPTFFIYSPDNAKYIVFENDGISFWKTNVFQEQSNDQENMAV